MTIRRDTRKHAAAVRAVCWRSTTAARHPQSRRLHAGKIWGKRQSTLCEAFSADDNVLQIASV